MNAGLAARARGVARDLLWERAREGRLRTADFPLTQRQSRRDVARGLRSGWREGRSQMAPSVHFDNLLGFPYRARTPRMHAAGSHRLRQDRRPLIRSL